MAKRRQATPNDELRKVQPKLRMFINGSSVVNTIRAEHASALFVSSPAPLRAVDEVRTDFSKPLPARALPKSAERGRLKQPASNVCANVFVAIANDDESVHVDGSFRRRGQLVATRVPLSKVRAFAADPNVAYVELAEPLIDPTPIVTADSPAAPSTSARKVASANLHRHGAGVLVGIIDVQGFDFAHPDFLEGGSTRFHAIWDQGGVGKAPGGFHYGHELRKIAMDKAIARASRAGAAATELEPQSQMDAGSHGTHVASIAAGNRGVASKAVIAGVLVSMPEEDLDRRKSFYDSTRIVDAVEYLLKLGEELKLPVSINVSLGTNGHAHDGTSAMSRWLDMALSVRGRCICVAAGNAGQEKATAPGDIGYVMGRIHTSGQVAARELTHDVDWVVVGNGRADISENELELWYSPQDRFAVSIRPPGGDWIGPVEPGEFIENRQLPDKSMVSIYNELYAPANGCNYIAMFLSPFFSQSGVVGVPSGTWTLRIHAREIRNGKFHAWIERDDPRPVGRNGPVEYWAFPSFFSERSNVDNSSISSLACGHHIVAVANLHEGQDKINISSSQGPTRDNRFKPDVAAPGTDIVAAKAFSGSDDLWIGMTGTSMASPFVAGVAALMLATNAKLTSAQIIGILQRTARPLPGADFTWRDDAGFGAIDPEACVKEAHIVSEKRDRT